MFYRYVDFKSASLPWNQTARVFDRGGLGCPQDYRDLPVWTEAQFNAGRGVILAGKPKENSNAHFVDGRPLPTPLKGTLTEYRLRHSMSKKEFERQRSAGSIVLQPLEQCKFTYETTPAVKGVGAFTESVVTSSLREGPVGTPFPINPCNGYEEPGHIRARSYNLVSCDPVRLASGASFGPMSRRYQVYPDYFYFEPTPADIAECWSSIQEYLEDTPWDKGLITSVSAEANSGVIDLYTNLAESKETFSWILTILRDAIQQYVKVRRSVKRLTKLRESNPRDAANIQAEINSRWMEYRYAVMPLAYTVDDILSAMQAFFSPYQSFRSGNLLQPELETDNWTMSFEVIDRVFLKHRYSHEAWNHNLGTNPFVTAWELVPASFIVDWFVNIGDLLSSLSVPSHVQEQNALYSRQIKLDSNIVCHSKENPEALITFTGGFYKATPFDPLLQVGVQLGFDMNWKRWLDAFALSWSSIRNLIKI